MKSFLNTFITLNYFEVYHLCRNDFYDLQHDMNRLSAWSSDWLMDFSVEKCSVFRIRKKIEFPYCINGQRLNETSEQKGRARD